MEENQKLNKQLNDLRKLKLSIHELRKIYDDISNETEIKKNLKNIIIVSDKIYKEVVVNTGKLYKIRNFNNYYIITVQKVLKQYINLKSKKVTTEETENLYIKIESFIQNVSKSFEKIYNSLFEDVVLDIDTEIKIMMDEMK